MTGKMEKPMNTKPLEKFAQTARRQLQEQVAARLEQVLRTDSAALRAKADVVAELNKQIADTSRQAVVERVAYTWFNRFCALRYMDANRYTRSGVVSPAPGHTQPEILQEAKAGHIDPDLAAYVDSQRVFDLLSGRLPSPDGQAEAYRELLTGSCNQYHAVMPFLFEKIDDYTELLMPADLLSANSVLQATREALTADVCQDVEVIGWLYQFYISEKKDEVIGAKQKITPENIPAATQLFTPNWIVRYLVQNSLGRLWLLNRPHSRLAAQMEFYIAPERHSEGAAESSGLPGERFLPAVGMTGEGDFLRVNSPEELTVCDPAVGSGHMLTYAFDLLYAIYEEEGYNAPDIPRLILQRNLTGLEIDERAAALAAFALTMKARAKDRRFFKRGVTPAITTLRPIHFTAAELDAETQTLLNIVIPNPELVEGEESSPAAESKDSSPLAGIRNDRAEAIRHDLTLFGEADNFGSLLRPMLSAAQLTRLRDQLDTPAAAGQLQIFDEKRRQKALQAVTQAIPLARQYDVVIANPPYMGSKNQNDKLKKFMRDGYKDVKVDLFSAFTVRIMEMTRKGGFIGMMTPFNWMFLSSFEKMRQIILDNYTLTNLVRPEFHAFFDSAFVTICAFTLFADSMPEYKGAFIDLQEFYGADVQPVKALEAIQNPDCGYFYRAAATDFKKIPGSPIAYWVSESTVNSFEKGEKLSRYAEPRLGMATGNNTKYLRLWYEIPLTQIGFDIGSREMAKRSGKRWFPYNKGGDFRRWYGNNEYVVDWWNDGHKLQTTLHPSGKRIWAHNFNLDYIFKPSITWTFVSSSAFGVRQSPSGFLFDVGGSSAFPSEEDMDFITGFLGSKLSFLFLKALNPTMNFQAGNVGDLPVVEFQDNNKRVRVEVIVRQLVAQSKNDWDFYESSWNFTDLPLLRPAFRRETLAATYAALRAHWQEMTLEMQRLEEENNRIFIEAYGLQDELTPDVPLSEITLTCNPHYRYGGQAAVDGKRLAAIRRRWPEVAAQWPPGEEGRELRLLADTMREFISYAVGCMFGRYSLDKPGLILANQGETVEDYVRKVTANPALSFRIPDRGEESSSSASTKDSSLSTSSGFGMTGGDDITFMPDADNAIPILDGEWFPDDITERFKKFLRVTFGDEHYAENLAFMEAALGKDIRRYFLREFYSHHVKMYKKRPIYWLFSSAKGSFNVLIYMHRYRPDTVSVILNDYLREFRAKLNARKRHLEGVSISASATRRDKTRALKEIDKLDKTLKEIREYEDDVLYPLATRQVEIDLDDGVKVNYPIFGAAPKKIAGVS